MWIISTWFFFSIFSFFLLLTSSLYSGLRRVLLAGSPHRAHTGRVRLSGPRRGRQIGGVRNGKANLSFNLYTDCWHTRIVSTWQESSFGFNKNTTRICLRNESLIIVPVVCTILLYANRASSSCKCSWKIVSSKLLRPPESHPFVSWTVACWTSLRICPPNNGKTCSMQRASKKRTWPKGNWSWRSR